MNWTFVWIIGFGFTAGFSGKDPEEIKTMDAFIFLVFWPLLLGAILHDKWSKMQEEE